MRLNLVTLILLFSFSALAKVKVYSCTHRDSMSGVVMISYKPQSSELSYSKISSSGKKRSLSASGENIEIKSSPFGKVVSMVDWDNTVIDEVYHLVGLILPPINLPKDKSMLNFNSQMVLSKLFSSIAGPSAVKGPLQENHFTSMKCAAHY